MLLLRAALFSVLAVSAAVAQTYTYDADGVLRHVDHGSTNRVRYTFDPGGNLLSVQGPTQLEVWRHQNFGTLDPVGAAADGAVGANDGVPNLVKYALGLAPDQQAQSDDVSQLIKTPTGLEFYYWARTGDERLNVRVQRSSDLANWSTDQMQTEILESQGSINLFKVLHNTSGPAQFMRLFITYSP
jgi:hypothetical protein